MMRRYFWGGAAVLLAILGQTACQISVHPATTHQIPTLPHSARPENPATLTSEQVDKAAKLWIAKCARCHPLYDPNFYSDVEWHSWMTKMSKKAHIKIEQEELLSCYLAAFRCD